MAESNCSSEHITGVFTEHELTEHRPSYFAAANQIVTLIRVTNERVV